MSGFNSVVLLGRCKATEELQTRGGKLFVKATLSVSIRRKNADGTDEERISLIPATIFGKTAEVFTKYVKAGDMVHLVGRLDSNEYTTSSGDKRLILSFNAETVNLLPNERAKPQQKTDTDTRPKPQPKRQEASQSAALRRPQPNFNEYGEPDDIPF